MSDDVAYMTTDETAQLLRRSRRTIERMCRRGDFAGHVPFRKVGHGWLIERRGLMAWLTGPGV